MSRVVTAAFAASLCVAAAAVGARDGAAGAAVFANGVNLGGWLLTEPSWMYDQFEAAAEGDLVAALRRAGGDGFAVQTMRNHWAGYIPDAALDAFAAWGGTHVRVPVGFWIVDTPVGGGSMLEYGFSHEGFVTGGLNYLAEVIPKLKARGLRALIDMHALPGGASNCQSYSGWQVPDPNFWDGSPPASNATPIAGCGGGGPYYTSRGAAETWMHVGEAALGRLVAWVASLEEDPATSGVVFAVEAANEPALGWPAAAEQPRIKAFLGVAVPATQAALNATGAAFATVVNFVGDMGTGMGAWLAGQVAAGAFRGGGALLVDYHYYLNWDGAMSWAQLAKDVCDSPLEWAQYTAAGLPVVIGEWSGCSNLGDPAYTNISDAGVRAHLSVFFANQMSLFYATPGSHGQFYWTLRMGSGWDPRPTPEAPAGHQVAGSAWDTSLPGFGAAVWNLGELIRVGVAAPLSSLAVEGVCKCNGCGAGL